MYTKRIFAVSIKFICAIAVGVFIWAEGTCLSAAFWPSYSIPMSYTARAKADNAAFGDAEAIVCKSEEDLTRLSIAKGDGIFDFSKNYVIISKQYPIYSVTQLREEKFPFNYTNEVMIDFDYSSGAEIAHVYTVPRLDYKIVTE